MNAEAKRKILELIQNTEDALQYAREALEKEDVDEVENQLDLASEYSASAFFTSEKLKGEE